MIFLWVLALLAAAIALIVIVCKFVDRRRQMHAPAQLFEMEAAPGTMDLESLPTRSPPLFSDDKKEKVARLAQIAPLMRAGDPGTFRGREFHSYLIMIPSCSNKSHAWLLDVEKEGQWDAEPYIIDTTLKHGVTRRKLIDEVTKCPGQWYWARVKGEQSRHYHRGNTIEAAMEMVKANTRYGWPAIIYQTLLKFPSSCVIMYLTGLGNWSFFRRWPFCSGALAIWMRKGGTDICKDRAPELIVPQDVDQCPLFDDWVALFP